MDWSNEIIIKHNPDHPEMNEFAGMRASGPQTLHAWLSQEGMLEHAIREFRRWCNQMHGRMAEDMRRAARTLIYFADSEWHIRLMLAFVQDVYHEVES